MSATDPSQQALRWLTYAFEGLGTGRSLQSEEPAVPRHICFLSQQAAEKALKAVLVYIDIEVPRTHDLTSLWRLIPREWHLEIDAGSMDALSEWAIESRYPGDWPEATDGDAELAIEVASSVIASVSAELKRRGL